jgi:hypothetical protein
MLATGTREAGISRGLLRMSLSRRYSTITTPRRSRIYGGWLRLQSVAVRADISRQAAPGIAAGLRPSLNKRIQRGQAVRRSVLTTP